MINKKCSHLLICLFAYCILPEFVNAQLMGTIQSFNKQDFYVTYYNELGMIYPVENQAGKELATFIIRKGLANPEDNYVSLEAAAWPGFFLRHQDQILKLQPKKDDELFLEDATFKLVLPLGTDDRNWLSFESFNYPGYYIRHKNNQLLLEENDESKIFKMDATFRFILPLWNGKNKTVKTKIPVVKKTTEDRDTSTIIMLAILGTIYIGLNLAAKIKQKQSTFRALDKNSQTALPSRKPLVPDPALEPGSEITRKTDQTIN